MTDYTTVDRERLLRHLGRIASVLRAYDGIPADVLDEVDQELSEINYVMNEISKPIHVEQRHDGFEITVVHE